MGRNEYLPLFETKAAKGRRLYWLYALSMLVSIAFVCVHRVMHFPPEKGLKRWAWTGIFMAELWFIFYWMITQFVRYGAVYCYTLNNRLSHRYEDVLPGIDTFVCTADHELEPPLMVVNTVLSVMAYDYPPEKLNVYLSDDAGFELMFYALLEASQFSGFWLPFCRKFNVEPRAPNVYFSSITEAPYHDPSVAQEWHNVKLSSTWVLPYTYVFIAKYNYSMGEFLSSGGTLKGWYNYQRMWLYKRVTSYLYGFCRPIMRPLGFAKLSFVITGKTVGNDVSERYRQGIMEFGAASSMFIIIATMSLFNLLTLILTARNIIINAPTVDLDSNALEMILNGLVVTINFPIFQGLFLRKDQGRMPASVTYQSLIFAKYLLTMY